MLGPQQNCNDKHFGSESATYEDTKTPTNKTLSVLDGKVTTGIHRKRILYITCCSSLILRVLVCLPVVMDHIRQQRLCHHTGKQVLLRVYDYCRVLNNTTF